MNLHKYYAMVENCISQIGVDPIKCRDKKVGQWNLKKGSASVWIDVFIIKEHGYFQCMAPVSAIPKTKTLAFYQEVLEINNNLYGVGMTKFNNGIYIKTIRELEGIEEREILAQMNRIGSYADEYDNFFKEKYFADDNTPGSDPKKV